MYLMYVDESGDCGELPRSPSPCFALVGLVVHELRWQECLDRMVDFRRRMREEFGLRLREEIHAGGMISKPGPLARIRRNDRLTIIRAFANELSAMPDLNLLAVTVEKRGKPAAYDVFGTAWRALIRRFESRLAHHHLRGSTDADDKGLLMPDHTDDGKVVALLRRMRRHESAPNHPQHKAVNRELRLANVIEDPNFKDSRHSFFIQAADVAAFLLYQQLCPSTYMRRKGATNYFERLDGIICKAGPPTDLHGIVRL